MSDLYEAYTSAHAYATAHDEPAARAISMLYAAAQPETAPDSETRLKTLKQELAKFDKRRSIAA